jgi:hypothetical protein
MSASFWRSAAAYRARILNVVLGNAAIYNYDHHRSPPYIARDKCAILPQSAWNSRMPLLTRAGAPDVPARTF